MAKCKNNKPKEQLNSATTDALEVTTGNKDASIDNASMPKASGSDALNASKIKDEVTPKAVFNTKKAVELVGDGSVPSSGMGLMLMRQAAIPFGGGAGQISTDKSATVKGVGLNKSGDRPGRTIDTALRHLDDIPAETFTVPITTIPQLRDGASNVGYNGNYENEHAVSQKGSGGSPASNKFFRTLDLVEYDNLYFAEGQMNLAEEETLSVTNWNKATKEYDEGYPTEFSVGNYLLRALHVTISPDNNITKLNFDVDDLSRKKWDEASSTLKPDYLSEDESRAAGDAVLRQRNIAELDRLKMAQEAGDENVDGWSPLGSVLHDPTHTNRMYKEMDAMAGDFVYLSANKLASALSFQLNKAAKDGMRKVSPIYEMNEGNIEHTTVRHGSYDNENAGKAFDSAKLGAGSAALFIAINDSTPKYNTKSKFLSLPLSYKTAIETVKKNCGSLKMHNEFYNEYNRQEVFGKIDADGSGMTPYFLSDGAGVILPIDITQTFNNNALIIDNKIAPAFNIHYEDKRNRYDYDCYNFFVQGLVDWFVRKAKNIRDKCNADPNSDFVLHIPITSTTSCLSLWDLIVCDASKDIAVERQYAMEPVLRYERMHSYPYSGLKSLGEVSLFGTTGIGFSDITEPLRSSPVPLNVAVRLLMPEVFTMKSVENFDTALFGGNLVAAQVVVPWYFNQDQFEPRSLSKGKRWELRAADNSYMTFFDVRGGVTFGNMDRILSMDPEQLKLCMDRMVTLPAIHKAVDQTGYTTKTYKYSDGDDGLVVNNYYVYTSDDLNDKARSKMLLIRDILSTPRELGLSMIAPAGIVTPAYDGTDSNYRKINSAYFRVSGPSFRLKYWHVSDHISNTIFEDHIVTGQGINFSARYDTIEATPDRGMDDLGIYVYANKLTAGNAYVAEDIIPFKQVNGDGSYDPDSSSYRAGETTDTGDKAIKLNSILKYLYARVQLLPFILNPFDACCYKVTGKPQFKLVNKLDEFDFLHLYNVCGFRAGEYSGVQYDRNRARINLGLGYVSDPYIERRL